MAVLSWVRYRVEGTTCRAPTKSEYSTKISCSQAEPRRRVFDTRE